jgi:predicted Zn finger-like uncharacterized protein
MSLITQCPACSTLFKVVQDQLRVSDGWVRCGQCDEVFDANKQLRPSTPPEPAPESFPGTEFVASAAPDTEYDWGAVTESADTQVPSDQFLEKSPHELSTYPEWSQEPSQSPAQPDQEAVPEDFASGLAKMAVPTFMASSVEPPVSPARWSRVVMAALSIGLLFLLLVQVLHQERDWLVASQPALRPVVETVCIALDCGVAPLHRIETVVIDSSSFAKSAAGLYKLQFTLKNVGSLSVAIPALELTLTDSADQAALRRVLRSSDLAQNREVLAAGEELSSSLVVKVNPVNGVEKIAGYRLLAFYP